MAHDVVALLTSLGHDRFAVAGHDRGSYVAFRLAMDRPDAVTRLAVLDSVPIGDALARADARFAREWWHWFFFAQPERPERAILADPDSWYRTGPQREAAMGAANYADFMRAIHNPTVVRCMLEDYRAGLDIDRGHDDADRAAGRQLRCPVLVAWSTRDDMERLYGSPVQIWASWAGDLHGQPINSGHHMAEDNPEELAAALIRHLEPLL
jgi:haloacetate dehalogenase